MEGVRRRTRTRVRAGTMLVVALVAACGSEAAPSTTAAAGDSTELFEDVSGASFGDPIAVTNEFFPLAPGTRLVYEGTTMVDGEPIPHLFVSTVTDLTKMIGDVRTVVVWDEDYEDGSLVEAELAFFAQDDAGNVWHFGEYPEEYEDGELLDAPAWIAGYDGARPGVHMKARPETGLPSYAQGWGPAVEWYDRAQVVGIGQEVCVASGCYSDVAEIEEFDLAEPHIIQVKWYAPGVGNVLVGWRGPDPDQEELELVAVEQLDAEAMAEARAAALALEARAYEMRPSIYGDTPPAEERDG